MAVLALLSCRPGSAPEEAPHYSIVTVPGEFVPPTADQRRHAIGSLEGVHGLRRRVFEEGTGMFEPVVLPQEGDWLDERPERFQTYERYRTRRTIHPDQTRRAIYVVEIGELSGDASPPVDALTRYVEAYYGMPVKRLPPMSVAELEVDGRGKDGLVQLHATQILDRLRDRRPDDAFAVAAITMYDLYPDDSWSFVFGFGDAADQVGVFSFARFDPQVFGRTRGADFESVLLRRSVNTLVHELGHMFGVSHCTHYRCVMNGHNHEKEGAALPMHLCPVDLRKLQHSAGFDPVERYRELAALDRELGFVTEAQWIERRLAWIEHGR